MEGSNHLDLFASDTQLCGYVTTNLQSPSTSTHLSDHAVEGNDDWLPDDLDLRISISSHVDTTNDSPRSQPLLSPSNYLDVEEQRKAWSLSIEKLGTIRDIEGCLGRWMMLKNFQKRLEQETVDFSIHQYASHDSSNSHNDNTQRGLRSEDNVEVEPDFDVQLAEEIEEFNSMENLRHLAEENLSDSPTLTDQNAPSEEFSPTMPVDNSMADTGHLAEENLSDSPSLTVGYVPGEEFSSTIPFDNSVGDIGHLIDEYLSDSPLLADGDVLSEEFSPMVPFDNSIVDIEYLVEGYLNDSHLLTDANVPSEVSSPTMPIDNPIVDIGYLVEEYLSDSPLLTDGYIPSEEFSPTTPFNNLTEDTGQLAEENLRYSLPPNDANVPSEELSPTNQFNTSMEDTGHLAEESLIDSPMPTDENVPSEEYSATMPFDNLEDNNLDESLYSSYSLPKLLTSKEDDVGEPPQKRMKLELPVTEDSMNI